MHFRQSHRRNLFRGAFVFDIFFSFSWVLHYILWFLLSSLTSRRALAYLHIWWIDELQLWSEYLLQVYDNVRTMASIYNCVSILCYRNVQLLFNLGFQRNEFHPGHFVPCVVKWTSAISSCVIVTVSALITNTSLKPYDWFLRRYTKAVYFLEVSYFVYKSVMKDRWSMCRFHKPPLEDLRVEPLSFITWRIFKEWMEYFFGGWRHTSKKFTVHRIMRVAYYCYSISFNF